MVRSHLTLPRAMTREVGGSDVGYDGRPPVVETAPDLVWPLNVQVYDQMRKSDAQLRALSRSIALPILSTQAHVVGSDVDEKVRKVCEAEVGLALDSQGRRKSRRGGVSFDEFLRHVMIAPFVGLMPFELKAVIGPQDLPTGFSGDMAHLSKLAPRMPRTIDRIDVDEDGGLAGIWQNVNRPAKVDRSGFRLIPTPDLFGQVFIPVERLAMFSHDREGSGWDGNSILRSSYAHWLIKDALMRVGALSVDRMGMGLPVVTYPAGGGNSARMKALDLATSIRVGDESGVALEEGWTVNLLGVQGNVADALEWVKYHDQAMSRAALTMFLDLGHDGGLGQGSLGDTFVDFFLLSERYLLRWIEEVFTEYVIRPFVRWNWGEDEPYPALMFDDPRTQDQPTAQALAELARVGLLLPDEAARVNVRTRFGLPPEDPQPESTGGVGDVFVGATGRNPSQLEALARTVRWLVQAGYDPDAVMQMLGLPAGMKRLVADASAQVATGQLTGPTAPPRPDGSKRTPRSPTDPQPPFKSDVTGQVIQHAEEDMGALLSAASYDEENRLIKRNRRSRVSQDLHPFVAARWTTRTGSRRCLLCGQEPVWEADGLGGQRVKPCTGRTTVPEPVGPVEQPDETPALVDSVSFEQLPMQVADTKEAEDAKIAASKQRAKGRRKHVFRPAKFPGPNGTKRCLFCGDPITRAYVKGGYAVCWGAGQPAEYDAEHPKYDGQKVKTAKVLSEAEIQFLGEIESLGLDEA